MTAPDDEDYCVTVEVDGVQARVRLSGDIDDDTYQEAIQDLIRAVVSRQQQEDKS